MPKNNPLIDGLLAGTAVDSLSGRGGSDRGSNAFLVGALTAYRSAKQNEEYDRTDRDMRRRNSLLEAQSAEVNSRISELEARQAQAEHAEAQKQQYVSSVRSYIVVAEQWVDATDTDAVNVWELANLWLFQRTIRAGISNFDIGLDEQRAIAKIGHDLAALTEKASVAPVRLIASAVGLGRSVSYWTDMATLPPREIRPIDLALSLRRYRRRLKRAQHLGLLDPSATQPGINLSPGVIEFAEQISGIYPESAILESVSGSGVAPFSKAFVEYIKNGIHESKSVPPPTIAIDDPLFEKGGYAEVVNIERGSLVQENEVIAVLSPDRLGKTLVEIRAPEKGHIAEVFVNELCPFDKGCQIARYVSNNYEGELMPESSELDSIAPIEQEISSGPTLFRVLLRLLYTSLGLTTVALLAHSILPDSIGSLLAIIGITGLMFLAPICGIWGVIRYFSTGKAKSE